MARWMHWRWILLVRFLRFGVLWVSDCDAPSTFPRGRSLAGRDRNAVCNILIAAQHLRKQRTPCVRLARGRHSIRFNVAVIGSAIPLTGSCRRDAGRRHLCRRCSDATHPTNHSTPEFTPAT